ncbi:MAG: FAD binding domain-containing protein [bacterium]
MRLPPFHLHRPQSLADAVAIAATHGDTAQYIAGGTDLLQHLKNRVYTPRHVISLQHIPGLREITPTRLGALATLADIESHPAINAQLPALADCLKSIASPIIRTTATLGGNLLVDTRCYFVNQSYEWRLSKGACLKSEGTECLVVPNTDTCYATFSADSPALLMAWDASVHLVGPAGERDLPIREFYQYDGIVRLTKLPAEIIAWVDIPAHAQELASGYSKLRIRDAFDYPEIGVAAALRLDPDSTLREFHLIVNAVEAIPLQLDDLGTPYLNQPFTTDTIHAIGQAAMDRGQPYRNTALTPGYRKQMIAVYTRRLLQRLLTQAVPTLPA